MLSDARRILRTEHGAQKMEQPHLSLLVTKSNMMRGPWMLRRATRGICLIFLRLCR